MSSLRAQSVAFMLLASLLIASTTLLAKLLGGGSLGHPLHPLQISHGRFVFAFLAIGGVVAMMRPSFQRPNLKVHVARSVAGWCGVSLLFAAVGYIPLGDATAISFLNPVFAMFLAMAFLGESVGRWRWGAAIAALVGALVLLKPGAASFQPAALLALTAAVVMGVEITLIKLLSGRERPLQILFINNALGVSVASLAVIAVWQPPTAAQWLALAALGGLMALAQACFIQSMRRAEASFVVPFSYATLVFAALMDGVVFRQWPDAPSLLGAAIIVAGGAVLAWREGRAQAN